MRIVQTSVLALVVLLTVALLLPAQPPSGLPSAVGGGEGTSKKETPKEKKSAPKPAAGSLEEMLDTALKNSPDIKTAEAKVREAEAELNRVRHQVFTKVISLRNEIDAARKTLEYLEGIHSRAFRATQGRAASQEEIQAAQASVDSQKAKLTQLQADLDAALGKWKLSTLGEIEGTIFYSNGASAEGLYAIDIGSNTSVVRPGQTVHTLNAFNTLGHMINVNANQAVQAPMAERIRAALDKTVKLEEPRAEQPLKEALESFRQKAGIDVPFRYLLGNKAAEPVLLLKGELPVGAWLQVFEDSAPEVRFVVREYGILVTTRDRVPEGAVRVHDFWRQKEALKAPAAEEKAPKK
jgi:hypothetical protein